MSSSLRNDLVIFCKLSFLRAYIRHVPGIGFLMLIRVFVSYHTAVWIDLLLLRRLVITSLQFEAIQGFDQFHSHGVVMVQSGSVDG